MSAAQTARVPRWNALLAAVLALGAAFAVWVRPKTASAPPAPATASELAPGPVALPDIARAEGAPAAPALAPHAIDDVRASGLARLERGEDRAALELLAPVYRARPEDDAVALAIAEASLRTRDLKTAELVIAALRSPETPEALRMRGMLFENASRLPEALALYERAIPGLQEPRATQEARARVLSWLGRFDEAAAGYAALIADAQVSVEQKQRARVRVAELTAWKKDLDGALEQLQAVLADDPARADALLLQGQVLEWQGRYAEAKRSYSTLLAADASHAEARLRLDKLLWVR